MLSTPVCGVAIRNDTVAPLLAPSRLRPIAVGMTPHEHRGSGTPNRAESRTERKLRSPRYFV